MPHSLSAKKRVRQTVKRNARNRARKDALKTEMKAFGAALTSGDAKKAGEALNKVTIRLDKIATKGAIHRKTASRRRSRLTKRLNALKAAPKPAKVAAK